MMEKITFRIDGEDEPAEFYVLEQTRISGSSYILVTDQADGDSDAWILKDLSSDGDQESIYKVVEDGQELDAVASVFREMLDDIDIT